MLDIKLRGKKLFQIALRIEQLMYLLQFILSLILSMMNKRSSCYQEVPRNPNSHQVCETAILTVSHHPFNKPIL